jgi:hypothetical protein
LSGEGKPISENLTPGSGVIISGKLAWEKKEATVFVASFFSITPIS